MEITTKHPEVGYINNVKIIEQALRWEFGFDDQSHVLTAVAATIWSDVVARSSSEEKQWGSVDVSDALEAVEFRVKRLKGALESLTRVESFKAQKAL